MSWSRVRSQPVGRDEVVAARARPGAAADTRFLAVLGLWMAWAAWGCGDERDDPGFRSDERRGYVFVSRAGAPFVLELDVEWGSRAVALEVGLAGKAARASEAAWSADGTQIAYLVW